MRRYHAKNADVYEGRIHVCRTRCSEEARKLSGMLNEADTAINGELFRRNIRLTGAVEHRPVSQRDLNETMLCRHLPARAYQEE